MLLENIRAEIIPGLSSGTRDYLLESAVVSLCRNQHKTGVEMECTGLVDKQEKLEWELLYSDILDRSFNDQDVATEHGACCISILYALQNTEYTVIRRARKKSGIDYWLGRKEDQLFQDAARLEISGIYNGKDKINSRTKSKKNQTAQSDSTQLPVYISVVEFGTPKISFTKK
ncbi:MAG: hypothetical protein MJZ61_09830 [Bacteroidales bacterium]|nr:hypothetical protein [Bacteroidales bacterium]